jgi:hypothetical protein
VTLFERHAGSTARHPSDNIFLDNGMSLSEMLRGGMQTEVKSSRKAAKDENTRKNQCISTGLINRMCFMTLLFDIEIFCHQAVLKLLLIHCH